MNDLLQTHDLAVGYAQGRRKPLMLLSRIDATIQAGELICLVGPNGAGKSTLLRTLAGLQPPLGGRVTVGAVDLDRLTPSERARRIGIVLTGQPINATMTGCALVALGRHPYTDWLGRLSAADYAVVDWAIDAVNGSAFAPRPLAELSDGQRQKLFIARALAQEPDLLLLDEPTAFLDLPRRIEIMRLLHGLARTTGRAIVLSTHDLDLALRSADRIWLMVDGRLHSGAPEDLVLNGTFGAAFRSEGVAFDLETGAFSGAAQTEREIALVGNGITREWTVRALARAGYRVSDGGTLCIEIDDGQAAPRWRLWRTGAAHEFDSLHSLIFALQAAWSQTIESESA